MDLPARSFDLARPGVAPPLLFSNVFLFFISRPFLFIVPLTHSLTLLLLQPQPKVNLVHFKHSITVYALARLFIFVPVSIHHEL